MGTDEIDSRHTAFAVHADLHVCILCPAVGSSCGARWIRGGKVYLYKPRVRRRVGSAYRASNGQCRLVRLEGHRSRTIPASTDSSRSGQQVRWTQRGDSCEVGVERHPVSRTIATGCRCGRWQCVRHRCIMSYACLRLGSWSSLIAGNSSLLGLQCHACNRRWKTRRSLSPADYTASLRFDTKAERSRVR